MVRNYQDGVSAETDVLAALLNDEDDRAVELLKQFMSGELASLRAAFFSGICQIDDLLKRGDHA